MTDDIQEDQLIHETPGATPNFRTELAAQLAELVPEAIADGKVDVAKLKELLDGDVGDESERFGLFWPGKRKAMRAAQEPTTATLRPDKENSKDWDTTQNVFIEGDNLEVLKILQKHYHNKIKMIYIDPPYNTGKDFVYPDNYKEGLESYLEWTRQVNDEGKKVSTNSESEGRYHSNWLNMMYPRLKLARNLLADDGAIIISIDDNELTNLRRLCDEIFGEQNFIGLVSWEKRYTRNNDAKLFSTVIDYLLIYRRSEILSRLREPRTDKNNESYRNPDNDPRGVWTSVSVIGQRTREERPSLCYNIVNPITGATVSHPTNAWKYSKEKFEKFQAEDRLYWGINGGNQYPRLKRFLSELEDGIVPTNYWSHEETGTTDDGSKEVEELLGRAVFPYPKPVSMLSRLIKMVSQEPEDIILDFFAGSATAAHGVLQTNAEDGGNRRYIMVQLPEPTPVDSEARKSGFSTISEISRTRIRKAGEKIEQEAGLLGKNLDSGFRAFILSDTNFTKWRISSDVDRNELEQHLFNLRESASDDATPDDLLSEILLKQGYSVTERLLDKDISGLDCRIVGENLVIAYLDEKVKPTLDQLRAMVDQDPQRIIILEDAFQGDDELKTNLAQLCKSKGIELWTA